MNNTRILTGCILVAIVAFLAYLNNPIMNFIIFCIILTIAFIESIKLYKLDSKNTYNVILAILFLIIIAVSTNEKPFSIATSMIFLNIMLIASIFAYLKINDLKPILPFLYPTAPIFLMFSICKNLSMSYLVWLILIVALCDTGAYFIGKKIGKTKFSQSSPNKTLEGVIGGIIVALIPGVLYGLIFTDISFTKIIITTILVSIFGVFGDLFESLLKRNANVKDSGNILPGHGGILDRIDGYLFGSIAMFVVFSW